MVVVKSLSFLRFPLNNFFWCPLCRCQEFSLLQVFDVSSLDIIDANCNPCSRQASMRQYWEIVQCDQDEARLRISRQYQETVQADQGLDEISAFCPS